MLNDKGREVPDNRPVAVPLGMKRPPTLDERIRNIVRGSMSLLAGAEGKETFEESDDFNVGDDYDPRSPWELAADQEDAALPVAPVVAKVVAEPAVARVAPAEAPPVVPPVVPK